MAYIPNLVLLCLALTAGVEATTLRGGLDESLNLPKVHFVSSKGTAAATDEVGADPGVDENYGYPSTVGGLIIEGPFNYTNGPTVWPDADGFGAYGLITVAPSGCKRDIDCPVIPDDSPLKPLEGSALNPFSMFSIETPLDSCMLSCNKTAIALTGDDPCAAGGITDPSVNPMSCYDIGSMAPTDMGVCGYNCTILHMNVDTPAPCTAEDEASGNWDDCAVYCDTRTFPGTAEPAATFMKAPARARK